MFLFLSDKGAKECVEAARLRIEEEVNELEQQVSIDCVIPQKFHRTIMGSKGVRVQSVTTEFGVRIKFPEKSMAPENETEADLSNGQSPVAEGVDETPKPCDIIAITGIYRFYFFSFEAAFHFRTTSNESKSWETWRVLTSYWYFDFV